MPKDRPCKVSESSALGCRPVRRIMQKRTKDSSSRHLECGFLAESTGHQIIRFKQALSRYKLDYVVCSACYLTGKALNVKLYFCNMEMSDFTIHEEQNGKLPIISLTCLCNRQMQWSK